MVLTQVNGMRYKCNVRQLVVFCKTDVHKALTKSLRKTHEKVCVLVNRRPATILEMFPFRGILQRFCESFQSGIRRAPI